MFCDRCGMPVREDQNFCPSCGKSFRAPAQRSSPRVGSHVRTLGVLWIVYSVLHLIPMGAAVIFGTVGLPWLPHDRHMPLFLGPMIAAFGGLGVLFAILGIVAGWGLLERRSWARGLAIVTGGLSLLSIPFGTALGIYTLWVLVPASSEQEYRKTAA